MKALAREDLRSACARPRVPRANRRRDAGDTLIEILITVVLLGLTTGALLAALGASGNAGRVQRSGVLADLVMRNYADATKLAAADPSCNPGDLLEPAYVSPPGLEDYDPAITEPPSPECPGENAATLTLSVTGPLGVHETMQIAVRKP